MSNTEVNVTLADLLEVYRHTVNNLENRAQLHETEHCNERDRRERAEKRLEQEHKDFLDVSKLCQERAKQNGEMAEKVKKLEGVIESLHIELQTEREAHQTTKENQA